MPVYGTARISLMASNADLFSKWAWYFFKRGCKSFSHLFRRIFFISHEDSNYKKLNKAVKNFGWKLNLHEKNFFDTEFQIFFKRFFSDSVSLLTGSEASRTERFTTLYLKRGHLICCIFSIMLWTSSVTFCEFEDMT